MPGSAMFGEGKAVICALRRTAAEQSRLRGQHAAPDLVLFNRLEQRLEVPFAEAVVALALDELEEDRPDHGLGENLQQDFGSAAFDDALAVDQDAVLLHALDRLVV